jgi:hypothetical protein
VYTSKHCRVPRAVSRCDMSAVLKQPADSESFYLRQNSLLLTLSPPLFCSTSHGIHVGVFAQAVPCDIPICSVSRMSDQTRAPTKMTYHGFSLLQSHAERSTKQSLLILYDRILFAISMERSNGSFNACLLISSLVGKANCVQLSCDGNPDHQSDTRSSSTWGCGAPPSSLNTVVCCIYSLYPRWNLRPTSIDTDDECEQWDRLRRSKDGSGFVHRSCAHGGDGLYLEVKPSCWVPLVNDGWLDATVRLILYDRFFSTRQALVLDILLFTSCFILLIKTSTDGRLPFPQHLCSLVPLGKKVPSQQIE